MAETTTIRVSKNTLRMLEKLRQKLGTRTLDETLRFFILQQRRQRLEEAFGIDHGKVSSFTEEDRGENSD